MNKSENKNGFTKVDHITFDIVLPLVSTSAQSIFLRIYRQTIGWKKQKDKIPHSHFRKHCRIKRHETINTAIEELQKLHLITVDPEKPQRGKIREYSINLETLMSYKDRYDAGEFEE